MGDRCDGQASFFSTILAIASPSSPYSDCAATSLLVIILFVATALGICLSARSGDGRRVVDLAVLQRGPPSLGAGHGGPRAIVGQRAGRGPLIRVGAAGAGSGSATGARNRPASGR